MKTFDGLAYDFQAVGEFTLLEDGAQASGAGPRVQIRTQPKPNDICPHITYITAVAAQVGSHTVSIYGRADRQVYIDGEAAEVASKISGERPGDFIVHPTEGRYLIGWESGERLTIDIRMRGETRGDIDVELYLPDDRAGTVTGLLGNRNDDRSDDLVTRDGAVLTQPVEWEQFYQVYAESWRIEDAESLFDYESGESTETYTNRDAPGRPTTVDSLPADAREDARQICESHGITNESLLHDCIIDVACTGDAGFAEETAEREPPEERIDVINPIFFDNWQPQGDTSGTVWAVGDDGSSVELASNDSGNVAVLVSSADYINTTIRGSFEPKPSDSNGQALAFCFGYHAPLAENGDPTDTYRTFIFSILKEPMDWFDGEILDRGARLSYADGIMRDDLPFALLGQLDSPAYQLLGSNLGQEHGWEDGDQVDFELEYRTDRVRIWIDDELVFDLTSEQAGVEFTPGRFGFLENVADGTVFSNISIQQISPDD